MMDSSPAVSAPATPSPIIARAIKNDRKPVDTANSPAPSAANQSSALWTRRGPKRSNNIPTRVGSSPHVGRVLRSGPFDTAARARRETLARSLGLRRPPPTAGRYAVVAYPAARHVRGRDGARPSQERHAKDHVSVA